MLLEEFPFDAVFADYWMPAPGTNGFYNQVVARAPHMAPRLVFLIGGVVSGD